MIKQQILIIRWYIVIILIFLNIVEVIFSVEYIIPPLIISGVFNWLFNVLCITALATLYCIYNPPAHFCVFNLHDSPHFHCQHAQLTLHILGKDYYHFTLVLTTTLSPRPIFVFILPVSFRHLYISNMIRPL